MSQTLVDISKIKDRDTAAAIDSTNVIIAAAGIAAGGAISGTTIDNTVIGGTTPVAGTFTTVTGNTSVTSPSVVAGTAARELTISGASGIVSEVPSGTDANITLSLQAKADVVALGGTTKANASMQVPTTASSVNFLQVAGATTGNNVAVTATGTDGTVGLQISPKSTGGIYLGGTTAANASAQVATVASAVNQVVITPAVTGTAPSIACGGSSADANRNLLLAGNGTAGSYDKGRTDAAAVPVGYVGEVIGDMVFGTATTATVTITIAAPGVVTWTAHGFSATVPQPVVFTTTGSLPTGITSGTVYYTVPSSIATNTFTIATSVANALAGTQVTTSGSQSGTQTGTAGTSMANGTAIDVTGMALTAGVWEVWAEVAWNLATGTTWTKLESSIGQTSATLATSGTVRGSTYSLLAQISAAATNGVSTQSLGSAYINVSATTNIFLTVKGAFASSTAGAYGFLFAMRVG